MEMDRFFQLLTAGSAGSALGVFFGRINFKTWAERLVMWFGGVATSVFCTPLVMELFEVKTNEHAYTFLVGLLGMGLASVVFRGLANADLWGFLRETIRDWLGLHRPRSASGADHNSQKKEE